MRAVHSDREVGVAARPEDNGLAPRLVDGPVADEPNVAVDEVGVGGEDLFEVRRASFLLSFPNEPDIRSEREVRRAERVECSELGEDGGLVIAGAARVDALLTIDGAERGGEGSRDIPVGGDNRLTIVVSIEDDSVRSTWRIDATVDDRWGLVGAARHR